MNSVMRGAAVVVALMLVVSCTRVSKQPEDAGVDAGVVEALDAAIVPAPVMLATNQGDIARFPDETPIASTRHTAQRTFSVREAPPSGAIVGPLAKGTEVTQIASRGAFVLIIYEKTPGTQVMGWVHKDVFSASIPDAGVLACAPGETAVISDGLACGKLCTADAECATGQACSGSANKVLPGNKPGEAVKVCTPFVAHDAGAGSAPDAGKPAVAAEAGVPGPPVNSASPDVVPVLAVGTTKCPATFVFVPKTGKCHRPCPKGPAGGECKNQPFFCIKCNDKDLVCAESQQCTK
ncbi:MAG: hypothetical protein KIT84_15450 [Labilithrix sp.]|nr:hypothetical protein [Labilithrix sp.]MCW5812421.1 hypothetical protein [Labilithrix sp.]